MATMFMSAHAFNQDLNSWNTAAANMGGIFNMATAFNHSLDSWSSLTNDFLQGTAYLSTV